MTTPWYAISAEQALSRLDTDRVGLTEAEVEARRQHYGLNEIPRSEMRSPGRIFVQQFESRLVQILIAATVFSLVIGEILESVFIMIIVVMNAFLGFVQEFRAEKALDALRSTTVSLARVRRDHVVREIPSKELVPGDIVLLQAGSLVPADGRLLESVTLRVQEAALTGESEAVEKDARCMLPVETPLAEQRNRVFLGTQVVLGHGTFVVTETGMGTALGQTAGMLRAVVQEPTPLQKQLDAFAQSLTGVVVSISTLVVLLAFAQGETFRTALLTAVSLAVAAVPEALAAVVTITLALGAQRMLKKGALIRKLSAVEALGSVNVICADKTGTLTQNRMTVSVLDVANDRLQLRFDDAQEPPGRQGVSAIATEAMPEAIQLLLLGAALCNDAVLENAEAPAPDLRVLGDPTEAALVRAAERIGWRKNDLDNECPRVAEIPFDPVRRRMLTVHDVSGSGRGLIQLLPGSSAERSASRPYLAVVKGAVEATLACCRDVWSENRGETLDARWRARITAAHDQMAADGMRVLAVAVGCPDRLPDPGDYHRLEQDLWFVGLIGIYDPPRPEAKAAVDACRRAGIKPVMITGDHPLTARSIAREVGIDAANGMMTGPEVDRLAPWELADQVHRISVFSRVAPEHKLKLIEAYQRLGWTVAMTGDGVNDAPALKKADIGIAMGCIGTDVAKESADLVLLDDNFATITAAIREGRVIYDNLVKFILYLLSCNVGEIAVVTFAPFLGMPLALLPLQILWMNLVTDGLPALALGVEPEERSVMAHPPSGVVEPLFGMAGLHFMLITGLLMTIVSLGIGFLYWVNGAAAWQTMLLTQLVFGQMAVALSLRSRTQPVRSLGWFTNRPLLLAVSLTVVLQLAIIYVPPLQAGFHTVALSFTELALLVVLSAGLFFGIETLKRTQRSAEGGGA